MKYYKSLECEICDMIMYRKAIQVFLDGILQGKSIEYLSHHEDNITWVNIDHLSLDSKVENHNEYEVFLRNEPDRITDYRCV